MNITTSLAWRATHEMRDALGYHVTMRCADSSCVARTPAGIRKAARLICAHASSRELLAFRIADTHIHLIAVGTRLEVGRMVQRVESSLKQAMCLLSPFEGVRIRLIDTQRYLYNAVEYVFCQEAHHGTAFDLVHDGSSLPDMLGMRTTAHRSFLERFHAYLPRLTSLDLLRWAGLESVDGVSPDLAYLADGAAAAFGLPDLGRRRRAPDARTSAVQAFGLSGPEVARRLGMDLRDVNRRQRAFANPAHVRAVERQVRARTLVAVRRDAILHREGGATSASSALVLASSGR